MTGFALDWLKLREPADHAARNRVVLAQTAAAFAEHDAVAIIDLGSGSGSTLRALSPHLPPRQRWVLVDNDPALLAAAAASLASGDPALGVTTREADLAADLGEVLDAPADLVTASALLDLVSEPWLDRLVELLAPRRQPFYAALSYDGGMQFTPAHPLDEEAVSAFNAHQASDKCFGMALGPAAAEVASRRFEARGATVTTGRADWRLEAGSRALQEVFLEGMFAALGETRRMTARDLADWRAFHRSAIAEDGAFIQVGHLDLFARW